MEDHLRASDADRERAAALLREHFAAGRLVAGELDERLAGALNAKTFGDLRRVLGDLPEPAAAQRQLSRLPPDRGGLESGYRRLLACYPAGYRRIHEEEMLAVLMTAAPDGKRRPGIAEAADLIWGSLRVRCQPARNGAEPAWRDALAVLSVGLPLVVLTTTVVQEAWSLHANPEGLTNPAFLTLEFQWLAVQFTAPLLLLTLALLPLQRVAGLVALALLIGLAYLAGWQFLRLEYLTTSNPYILLALGLQIAALTVSPGPRRGLRLLTWKHAAFTVLAAVAVVITSYPLSFVVIAVICAAMALSSSLGRWLLVLLAITAWPFLATPLYGSIGAIRPGNFRLDAAPLMRVDIALGPIGQSYLLPGVLLGLFVVAACRDSLRSRQLAPPSA